MYSPRIEYTTLFVAPNVNLNTHWSAPDIHPRFSSSVARLLRVATLFVVPEVNTPPYLWSLKVNTPPYWGWYTAPTDPNSRINCGFLCFKFPRLDFNLSLTFNVQCQIAHLEVSNLAKNGKMDKKAKFEKRRPIWDPTSNFKESDVRSEIGGLIWNRTFEEDKTFLVYLLNNSKNDHNILIVWNCKKWFHHGKPGSSPARPAHQSLPSIFKETHEGVTAWFNIMRRARRSVNLLRQDRSRSVGVIGGVFRATILLRPSHMRACCNWRASSVAETKTKTKMRNVGCQCQQSFSPEFWHLQTLLWGGCD